MKMLHKHIEQMGFPWIFPCFWQNGGCEAWCVMYIYNYIYIYYYILLYYIILYYIILYYVILYYMILYDIIWLVGSCRMLQIHLFVASYLGWTKIRRAGCTTTGDTCRVLCSGTSRCGAKHQWVVFRWVSGILVVSWNRVPLNHPFELGIFRYKPSIKWVAPFMETPILVVSNITFYAWKLGR